MAFGAVQPWAWASLAAIAGLLLVLWALEQWKQRTLTIVWSPLFIPFLGFSLLGVAQYAGSLTLERIATRESLVKLFTDLVLFFVVAQIIPASTKGLLRGFGLLVTLFAFSVALFAIFQYFSSGGLIYWSVKTASGNTFGPYVNHNHYAGLMEMLIPLVGANYLAWPRSSPLRPILGFALLVPISSLLLSASRGGVVALAAEVVVFFYILARYAPEPIQRMWISVLGLVSVAAALALFWLGGPKIMNRLATIANLPVKPEVTLSDRFAVSKDSLQIFADHPWTGTGLGTFEIIYPRYQSLITDLVWEHAHDDYVEALVETGLVGGILLVVALLLFVKLAFSDLRERLRHGVGWYQVGATLGCCGLLVHALADFNFHLPANAAWFLICVALATIPIAGRSTSNPEISGVAKIRIEVTG